MGNILSEIRIGTGHSSELMQLCTLLVEQIKRRKVLTDGRRKGS